MTETLEENEGESEWGSWRVVEVLQCVCAGGWLSPRDLAAARGVCRAWRRVAAAPHAAREALTARGISAKIFSQMRDLTGATWRGELGRVGATWRNVDTLQGGEAAESLNLCDCKQHLASTGVVLHLWGENNGQWNLMGEELRMEKLGWAKISRSLWSPDCTRVMLAGPVALSSRWELALVTLDGFVLLRAECGILGLVGWAHGSLLALGAPALVSPGLATTTLWLYAASQRTGDEYTGVATPLFRIFNEGSAHISHAFTTELSEDSEKTFYENLDEEYFHCMWGKKGFGKTWLVWASGEPGSRGRCTALATRKLRSLSPPPVQALGSLAERRAIHEAQRDLPDPEELTEEQVRLLCVKEEIRVPMNGVILGVAKRRKTVAATLRNPTGGVKMRILSLPTLNILHDLIAPGDLIPPYYVEPHIDAHFIGTPAGDGSGRVWLWSAATLVRLPPITLRAPPQAPPTSIVILPRSEHHCALIANNFSVHVCQCIAAADD